MGTVLQAPLSPWQVALVLLRNAAEWPGRPSPLLNISMAMPQATGILSVTIHYI